MTRSDSERSWQRGCGLDKTAESVRPPLLASCGLSHPEIYLTHPSSAADREIRGANRLNRSAVRRVESGEGVASALAGVGA